MPGGRRRSSWRRSSRGSGTGGTVSPTVAGLQSLSSEHYDGMAGEGGGGCRRVWGMWRRRRGDWTISQVLGDASVAWRSSFVMLRDRRNICETFLILDSDCGRIWRSHPYILKEKTRKWRSATRKQVSTRRYALLKVKGHHVTLEANTNLSKR